MIPNSVAAILCCEVGNWGRYSLPKLLFPFAFLLRPPMTLMVKDSHKIALQHQTWGLSNFISILPSGVSTLQRFRISQTWMKTGLLKNHRPVMDLSSQMCHGLEDSWWITHTRTCHLNRNGTLVHFLRCKQPRLSSRKRFLRASKV